MRTLALFACVLRMVERYFFMTEVFFYILQFIIFLQGKIY